MPNPVSDRFRAAAEAEDTDEVFVDFLTLSHPALIKPVRIANDTVDYLWDGERYVGCPIEAQWGADTDAKGALGRLQVLNVDPEIGRQIRLASAAPSVTLQAVCASQFGDIDPATDARANAGPVVVEAEVTDLRLARVTIDDVWITGDLTDEDYGAEPYGFRRGTKNRFPGLFP